MKKLFLLVLALMPLAALGATYANFATTNPAPVLTNIIFSMTQSPTGGISAAQATNIVQNNAVLKLNSFSTNQALINPANVQGNLGVVGDVTAEAFAGVGTLLTELNASELAFGTIPDDRFPAVLPAVDGSQLTSLPTTVTNRGYYFVGDYGIYPDGSDVSTPLLTLITNVQIAGGGMIQFDAGTYLVTESLTFHLNAGLPVSQNDLWLRGAAHHAAHSSGGPPSGTVLRLESTNGLGKIDTRGFGTLKISDMTLTSTSDSYTPFVKTIYTTLKIKDVMFYGSSATNPKEDGVILGGDGVGAADYINGGPDDNFQGYGTIIETCYFNRIRICAQFQRSANANWFVNNVVMNNCGGTNNPYGAAVVLAASLGSCAGNNLVGNLIEMSAYTNAFFISTNAASNNFLNNNLYDPQAALAPQYGYWFQNCSSGNTVVQGYTPPEIIPTGGNTITNQEIRTGAQAQTNHTYNVWHFNGGKTRFIGASAQPEFYDSASNMFSWTFADGIKFLYKPVTTGTNSQLFHLYRDSADGIQWASDKTLKITAGGNMSIYGGAAGSSLFLGNYASALNHYFNAGTLHYTLQGNGFKLPNGGALAWSETSAVSGAVGGRLTYTNGAFNFFGLLNNKLTNVVAGGFSSDGVNFTGLETNAPVDGYVSTAVGTGGFRKWAPSAGGSSSTNFIANTNGTGYGITLVNPANVEGNLGVVGDVTAEAFSGVGTLLTELNASELTSGLIAPGRLSPTAGIPTNGTYALHFEGGTNVWKLSQGGTNSVYGGFATNLSTANSFVSTNDILVQGNVDASGIFSGNGSGLTDLNAAEITGTITELTVGTLTISSNMVGNAAGLTNLVGNGAGLSNAVDLIAGINITITTNANNRSFTINSTGGGGSTNYTYASGQAGILVEADDYLRLLYTNNVSGLVLTNFAGGGGSITLRTPDGVDRLWARQSGGSTAATINGGDELNVEVASTTLFYGSSANRYVNDGNNVEAINFKDKDNLVFGGDTMLFTNVPPGRPLVRIDDTTWGDGGQTNAFDVGYLLDCNKEMMGLATNGTVPIGVMTNWSATKFNKTLVIITNTAGAGSPIQISVPAWAKLTPPGTAPYCTNVWTGLFWSTHGSGTNYSAMSN